MFNNQTAVNVENSLSVSLKNCTNMQTSRFWLEGASEVPKSDLISVVSLNQYTFWNLYQLSKCGGGGTKQVWVSVTHIHWGQRHIISSATDKGSTQVSTRGMHNSLSACRATDLCGWKRCIPLFSCSLSSASSDSYCESEPNKKGRTRRELLTAWWSNLCLVA